MEKGRSGLLERGPEKRGARRSEEGGARRNDGGGARRRNEGDGREITDRAGLKRNRATNGRGEKIDLRQNSRLTSRLSVVGSSGGSRDFRPSGLPTYVGTSDAGKQKNPQT